MNDIKSAAERAAERINAKVAGYSGSIIGSFQDWMEAVILEEAKADPAPETPRDDLWKFVCDVVCDPKKSWPKAAEIIREEVLRRAGVDDLRKANNELNSEVMKEALKADDVEAEFKNFHKNLCDRFGYVHDDVDWRRDQASLEEFIARKLNHNTVTLHGANAQLSNRCRDLTTCLRRAVDGGCIWKKGGDLVDAERLLKEPATNKDNWKCQSCDGLLDHDPIGTAGICDKCVTSAIRKKFNEDRRPFEREWTHYHDYIKSVAEAEYNSGASISDAIYLAEENATHVFNNEEYAK